MNPRSRFSFLAQLFLRLAASAFFGAAALLTGAVLRLYVRVGFERVGAPKEVDDGAAYVTGAGAGWTVSYIAGAGAGAGSGAGSDAGDGADETATGASATSMARSIDGA